MRIIYGSVLGSTLAALCAANVHAQVPLSLDTSFCTSIVTQNVNDLVVLSNGQLLCSGLIKYPGDASFRGSTRLNLDGSRDLSFTSFLGGGKITPWNGKYYITNGLVRRLDSLGMNDPSFIMMNDGPYFLSLQGGDYHVYPDGRILMSGTHTLSDTIRGFVGNYDLIWFSNEGYLDTAATHRKGNGVVYAMKELPNGQFVCTSTCTQFEGKAVDWIFKFNTDGTPDTTFRSDVIEGQALTLLGLDDGRIYAGGRFRRAAAPQDTLVLARFLSDGSLDPTWSEPYFDDGTLNGPAVGAAVGNVYPWNQGRLLVVGQFRFVDGQPRRGICLLDSTGALLPEFDDCGVDSIASPFYTYASISSVHVDSTNGYLYVCGAYVHYNDGSEYDLSQRFVTRLFLGSPSTRVPPSPIPTASLEVYPNPASQWAAITYKLSASEGPAGIVIRDGLGRVISRFAGTSSEGQVVWDTREIAPGAYAVELIGSQGPVAKQRVIVQR